MTDIYREFWEWLCSLFRKEPSEVFLYVRTGKVGIETFISPDVQKFNTAHKKQLIAFLEEAVVRLKNKNA